MKLKSRILIFSLLLVLWAPMAFSWTLQWSPVTKYTDNTVITRPVTYDTWVDNVSLDTGLTGISTTLPPPGSGVTHLYEVAAVVDNVSSTRAGLNWTSPLSQPEDPTGLLVVP